jgi:hypothetical protein
MSKYLRFVVAGLIVSCVLLWNAPHASAAYGYTELGFSDYLSGYSATWKDPWDTDFYFCETWDYDPYYDQDYCAEWQFYYFWVSVGASLYTPASALFGYTDNWGWDYSIASYYAYPDAYGTWTGVGSHYIGRDAYYQDCYSVDYCDPVDYWYTTWWYLGATSAAVYLQAPPAVPVNFHQDGAQQRPGGVLHFDYSWGSSSGNLADLGNCEIGELVTYPGGANPFVFPNPPWNQNVANPTIIWVPATPGTAEDNHSPPAFAAMYAAANVVASQTYRYRCANVNGNAPVDIVNYDIVRSVTQNPNGSWKYEITKNGASATIDPLP